MTVQSARVQELVKGDDVTLTHQIMSDVAYSAELSRAPVELTSADRVYFFYALQDGSNDLVGYLGTPVGPYPTSKFTVDIPGTIAATLTTPERGSKTFRSGQAQTVRAEVLRDYALLSQKRETYYLYEEVDVLERGFPSSPVNQLNLP